MAAVLLHTRDPLAVLQQAARRSDRVLVTELHVPERDGRPVQQLYPTLNEPQWHTWWRFSPDLFTQFFDVMGFATDAVTFHEQTHLEQPPDQPLRSEADALAACEAPSVSSWSKRSSPVALSTAPVLRVARSSVGG